VSETVKRRWPSLKQLFADSACDCAMSLDKAVVEVVRKMNDQHTFVPLRRRWASSLPAKKNG
jgi:putative transposase